MEDLSAASVGSLPSSAVMARSCNTSAGLHWQKQGGALDLGLFLSQSAEGVVVGFGKLRLDAGLGGEGFGNGLHGLILSGAFRRLIG